MPDSPIQISEIYAYADRIQLIGSLDEFVNVMVALDDAFLEYMRKENERKHSNHS